MLEPQWLKAIDLHLHVPRGAASRDGADLGIPMFVSVASLLLDIPTRAEVAASGEMTLRGAVLPVEGIKDKVLAAHRAGIREIVLPAKNARDMEEVPAEIRDDVIIRYVSRADEVLEWMLERPPNRNPRTLVRPSEPPSGEMHP